MNQVEPDTPRNLEELLAGLDTTIIFTMGDGFNAQKMEIHSILLTQVIPDILSDECITKTKKEIYTRLLNATHFMPNSGLDINRPESNGGHSRHFNVSCRRAACWQLSIVVMK